jgi:tetratricopeptide (TPR) repeat protein
MTDLATTDPLPEEGDAAASAAEAPPEKPAPEPWTPERVLEWNAYYDMYIVAFVLLLVFLGSANTIQPISSSIWSLLDAGRRIATTGVPAGVDDASVAAEGRTWANIPWLFELSQYQLFRGVGSLAPAAEAGETEAARLVRVEQWGAAALIAVNALIRALTAWLLLSIRRKGPGLWWTALCAAMALGTFLAPAVSVAGNNLVAGVTDIRGGIAGVALIQPATWGLFFLAIELVILFRAIALGKSGWMFGLVPLFALWANFDESYAFGWIILAASVVGLTVDFRRLEGRPSLAIGLLILVASLGATFATPSHYRGVIAAFGPLLYSVGLDLDKATVIPGSFFGPIVRGESFSVVSGARLIYFGVMVAIGLASFGLNARKFLLSRFLAFTAAAVYWGLVQSETPLFAAVWAATLASNGQEWYLGVFGEEGRTGKGWSFWSVAGRLVTIAVIFWAIFRGVTGWKGQVGDPRFGFGYDVVDFPFEAAEALKTSPIEGNVLNTLRSQGDVIAWRAAGKRKPFIDGRPYLYPRDVYTELKEVREEIRDDLVDKWKPKLDKYNITALMLEVDDSPKTYTRLMTSKNWIPFYDDGSVAMFGRADAPKGDLAYFEANRLDADALVYKRPRAIPAFQRPPTQVTELDSVFQNRLLVRPEPHTEAAARWLNPADIPPGVPFIPDPAHCLMAIREARIALSIKPDDPSAFLRLSDAYRRLLIQESALLAGIPPSPENLPKIERLAPQVGLLAFRNQQLITALNFALQTLPATQSASDRQVRAQLSDQLASLYYQIGAYDLARERLLSIDLSHPGELNEAYVKSLTTRLGELNQVIERIQTSMSDMVVQRRVSPQEKAAFARSNGAPGLAIHELEDVESAGGNPASVRPSLVDLYCDTGQPEKALQVIGSLAIGDATLNSGAGTASYRQGRVYFLLGDDANAAGLWRDRSIPELRYTRAMQGASTAQSLLMGEPKSAVRSLLELPSKVTQQAGWEFELGMAALEGGLPPEITAEHLANALRLEPDLALRPVIAYYLEKLGKPVPPPRAKTTATPATTEPAKPAETSAPAPTTELPPAVTPKP